MRKSGGNYNRYYYLRSRIGIDEKKQVFPARGVERVHHRTRYISIISYHIQNVNAQKDMEILERKRYNEVGGYIP